MMMKEREEHKKVVGLCEELEKQYSKDPDSLEMIQDLKNEREYGMKQYYSLIRYLEDWGVKD